MNKIFIFFIVILAVAIVIPQIALAAWWNPFSWGVWNKLFHNTVVCPADAKLCSNGSYVSRVPPNCDFAACPADETSSWKTYRNETYGFEIKFPESWVNYKVVTSSWKGNEIDGTKKYAGVQIVFKNAKLEKENHFTGIPIMIITPSIWNLISNEKISVSAAPIGPEKIAQNSKYVFATPPRWHGFADDLNQQQSEELAKIVKTLKAFEPSVTVEYKLWPDIKTFDLAKKTFQAKGVGENISIKNIKVVVAPSAKFSSQTGIGNKIITTTHDFQWFYNGRKNWIGPEWWYIIKGTKQADGSLLATNIILQTQ